MYQEFYGLKRLPFQLLPDPDFFYLSHKHDTALTHLEYGISQRAGFIVITGEIGTGKTTLLRYLLRSLDEDLPVATLSQTYLYAEDLIRAICQDFSLPHQNKRKPELLELFGTFLVDQYRKGKYVILILDEAQNLPLESLEELRMLSNLDADNERILQIILVGQPPLRAKLRREELRQLYQRIEVSYHLEALDQQELKNYIRYRIETAGGPDPNLFHEEAIETIFDYSGGVPRLINAVCHGCLVYGFAEGIKKIHRDLVEAVLNDREDFGLFPSSEAAGKQEISATLNPDRKENGEALSTPDHLNTKLDRLIELSGLSAEAFERVTSSLARMSSQTDLTGIKEQLASERKTRKAIEDRLAQVESLLDQVNRDSLQINTEAVPPYAKNHQPTHQTESKATREKPDKFQVLTQRLVHLIEGEWKPRVSKTFLNLRHIFLLLYSEGRKRPAIISMIIISYIFSAAGAAFLFSKDQRSNENGFRPGKADQVNVSRMFTKKNKQPVQMEPNALKRTEKSPLPQKAPEKKKLIVAKTTSPWVSQTPVSPAQPNDKAQDADSIASSVSKDDSSKAVNNASIKVLTAPDQLVKRLDHATHSYDMAKAEVDNKKLYSQTLTEQAKVLLDEGQSKKAEESLLKAVEADPDNFAAYFELGKLYTKAKEYTKAINNYQNAAELRPDTASVPYNLGFVYAGKRDYQNAEKALQRAAELNPPYADKVLFNLAVVQQKLGKGDSCIQNLQKSLSVNPSNRRAKEYLDKILGNADQIN